jgi:hypothetical protein
MNFPPPAALRRARQTPDISGQMMFVDIGDRGRIFTAMRSSFSFS